MKNLRSFSLCGALVLLVALQGCGDDNGDNPTPPIDVTPKGGTKNTGGNGGKSGNNDAGSSDGGVNTGNTGNTGTGNTGNTGNTGDGGNEPVGGNGHGGEQNIPDPVCELPALGEDGCFNCPEDGEQEQWLNRCAGGDCVDFDDSKLVKLGGDRNAPLPALPN